MCFAVPGCREANRPCHRGGLQCINQNFAARPLDGVVVRSLSARFSLRDRVLAEKGMMKNCTRLTD